MTTSGWIIKSARELTVCVEEECAVPVSGLEHQPLVNSQLP